MEEVRDTVSDSRSVLRVESVSSIWSSSVSGNGSNGGCWPETAAALTAPGVREYSRRDYGRMENPQ